MLPVNYRLKKRKAFNYLHKNGRHTSGEYLSVLFCPAANLKIGFTASKKVGNSVVRHRCVRLLREAVRPFLTRLQPKCNLIIIAKPAMVGQHLLYLTIDLEKALKKAGLLL